MGNSDLKDEVTELIESGLAEVIEVDTFVDSYEGGKNNEAA